MSTEPTDVTQGPDLPESLPVPAPIAPADRDPVAEDLHGRRIADPYRYLEDPDGERTVAFVRAQNAASAPYLAALPGREWFGRTVTTLLTAPRAGTPWERGGRYFRLDNPGDADQDRLLVGDSLDTLLTEPRVLLDPNAMSTDGTVALMACQVSPDGTLVAVALSEAGSDWRTVRVLNVADGSTVEEPLNWTKFVWPTWLPDGSGFLYWRYPAPLGKEYVDQMPPGELALHRLGTSQESDEVIWSRPDTDDGADWMVAPEFSADGRWLMLTAGPGTDSRTTVEVLPVDLTATDPFGPTIVVHRELTDRHDPVEVRDGRLILRTEAGAERGRVLAVDLADGSSEQLVAEHPTDILVSASPVAGGLLLVWSRDTAHRIELITDHGRAHPVQIESPASVVAVHSRGTSRELFVGTTSFTERLRIRRVQVGDDDEPPAVRAIRSGDEPTAGAAMRAVRSHGTSADGTTVPMTVIGREDLPAGPHPTLLYGYGGFDIPMVPAFSALFASWVLAGGVFVVANLRGGGEFGQAWHRAGMRQNKQRVFDDLYGCAEALIADGTTSTDRLAVHGRSNGGLLVGAAITQRPDLWAAALPTVGVLDMLRYHRFTIGRAWIPELGNPDDEQDFPMLFAYSPLHNLTDSVRYPPTLICTGDHDDRVVPAHSLKFGAQLQYVSRRDGRDDGPPVLLRIDTRAGHGMGKPVRALAAEYADQLAFAAAHTGLRPPRPAGSAG